MWLVVLVKPILIGLLFRAYRGKFTTNFFGTRKINYWSFLSFIWGIIISLINEDERSRRQILLLVRGGVVTVPNGLWLRLLDIYFDCLYRVLMSLFSAVG